ncbi:hypothetical protein Tco_0736415, partial [Tanacetum coccineum]
NTPWILIPLRPNLGVLHYSYVDGLEILIGKRALHESEWLKKKLQIYRRKLISYMDGLEILIGKRALHESEWLKKNREQDGSSSSGYDADAKRARADKVVSDKENVVVEPSFDNDTLAEFRAVEGELAIWHLKAN